MIELQDGESAKITNQSGVTKIEELGEVEPPPKPPPGAFPNGVSVEQFGAVGDGVADDTEAIQSALNSAVNTRLIFPRRGPWKITRKVLIKGACFIQGYGGARVDWFGDGGLGVSQQVGGIPYLRVEGLEINNKSGNNTAIGFGLNELNDVNYGGGPVVPINTAVILYSIFIRSKILLNNGTQGRTWFNNNLVESRDLGLWPYVILISAEGSHNPNSGDAPDNGMWCCENNIRAVCARPPNADFGTDSDLIKITNGITRVHMSGNKITNLEPDTVEAQIDVFTGGGRLLFVDNHISNTCLHYKQTGGAGGMQDIDAYCGLTANRNYIDWTTGIAGFGHAPIFVRGSGFVDVSNNFLTINTAGRQILGFLFDNTHDNSESGLGSASPRHNTIIGNRVWLRGRNDHEFLQVQPPSGTGPAAYYAVANNVICAPSGQSKATANLGSAHQASIVGNISPNSPAWSGGAGSVVSANIFR